MDTLCPLGQMKPPFSDRSGSYLSQSQLNAGVRTCRGRPSQKHLRRMLDGDGVIAIVVNDYLSEKECQAVTRNFVAAERHDRKDNVAASEVGGGAYESKSPRDQFRAYQSATGEVARLFEGGRDLVSETNYDIQQAKRRNQRLRPLTYDGLPAASLRASASRGTTEAWMLQPHDDIAQLRTPHLARTEFAWLQEPIAINIYPCAGRSGGELRVFGWMPGPNIRDALGLSETGYPYPDSILENLSWIDIPVLAGSAVFIRGSFVHGVRKGEADKEAPRIVVNGFFATSVDGSEIWRWC